MGLWVVLQHFIVERRRYSNFISEYASEQCFASICREVCSDFFKED
jgi:hypothetical protein